MPAAGDTSISLSKLDRVPDQAWTALARKRLYFGHHSVGGNILEGITELQTLRTKITLPIQEVADPAAIGAPGLSHSGVGTNRDPDSKIRGFEELLATGAGQRLDIAFFKFCYVDIGADTDVNALFDRYTQSLDRLGRRFPNITFAHITAPLTVPLSGLKWTIKRMLGEPAWGYRQNGTRERFNDLLRNRFGSSGLVFDLARFESTRPDGVVESYRWRGRANPSLARCYTADEGHLAEFGRRIIAREMLVWLATIASPQSPPAQRASLASEVLKA